MNTSLPTPSRQVLGMSPSLVRTLLVDALLLVAACLVPALSHLTALPLYHLNPMLLVLLTGMVLVQDRKNALLLAVLLPLVSMMAVGMPTPLKAVCMMAELATVVLISGKVCSNRFGAKLPAVTFPATVSRASSWTLRLKTFGIMLLAILGGKAVYYLLKALIIAPAVLVSTAIFTQAAVAVVAAAAFALLKNEK